MLNFTERQLFFCKTVSCMFVFKIILSIYYSFAPGRSIPSIKRITFTLKLCWFSIKYKSIIGAKLQTIFKTANKTTVFFIRIQVVESTTPLNYQKNGYMCKRELKNGNWYHPVHYSRVIITNQVLVRCWFPIEFESTTKLNDFSVQTLCYWTPNSMLLDTKLHALEITTDRHYRRSVFS